jgi:MFS family permease
VQTRCQGQEEQKADFAFVAEECYTPAVAAYLRMLRLFSRNMRLFLVAEILLGFTWNGVRVVLLNLYVLRLGYGPEFVGLLSAVGSLVFALSCPPAGTMGTRRGSRRMLIAGMGLTAAGFWSLPLASSFGGSWRSGWLLANMAFTNLGFAWYMVNALPFMMAASNPEERTHAFSVQMAMRPFAGFVGGLVAGVLPGIFATLLGVSQDSASAYRFPLWLGALLLVPAVLVLVRTRAADLQTPVFVNDSSVVHAPSGTRAGSVPANPGPLRLGRPAPSLPPTGPTSHSPSLPWSPVRHLSIPLRLESRPAAFGARRINSSPHTIVLAMALMMVIRFAGWGPVNTFYNVYLDEGLGVPTALIGMLSALGQLLSVPAALAAPLLVARWDNPRTIFRGTLAMAFCILPFALIPHWAPAGLGLVGATALFSLTNGPLRVFSQELVASNWRARMASAFMMGIGLALSGVSLVGGYVIVALGYRNLFLLGAGLTAAGALAFWACFRSPRGELAGGSPSQTGN